MKVSKIDSALIQLSDEIENCKHNLLRLIDIKKNPTEVVMKPKSIKNKLQNNPIAIVGMASLFPKAKNLQEYWQNIVDGVDCITEVPPSRWNIEEYYDPNPQAPEKTYSKKGGFIPDVDFNPIEFGLPPSTLEVTDISQLLSLVVAKEAMEDAGYGHGREFNRENVGVVLGVAQTSQLVMPLAARLNYPVWEKVLKSSGLSDRDTAKIVTKIKSAYVPWNENAFPGILANVVAGRIANRLDLGGMNCVVDAACASSLAAIKLAVSELLEHRCDMMLTGGVDTNNSINTYMCFSKTPALSRNGAIKPFDAESDGMIVGEGIGMMVLKRLDDAIADNDKIYAVIKGIGTSSDGRNKSIYAPSKDGQVKALARAYEDAGCSSDSIGLIEAHGTGTIVGDQTEFASLKEFFGSGDSEPQSIALGSVKSQIGHTKAAAGAASFIKTALALHHKILPTTINITEPNPKLKIGDSPFYLNTETRPWLNPNVQQPRRAGVSSFGFGGTNYHFVLEEYRGKSNQPYRLHQSPESILLFADNPEQLLDKCQQTLIQLQSEAGEKEFKQIVDASRNVEIPQTLARIGFIASSLKEACQMLQSAIKSLKNNSSLNSWEHPLGIYYRASGLDKSTKIVALFSGQGSQYLNMGRELAMNFPELRDFHNKMDELFHLDKSPTPSEIVFPPSVFTETEKNNQAQALQNTKYAQPAIGAFSAGLYQILSQAGFKPDFVAGHSFGELTALWAAGVLNDRDYCSLVKARGQIMSNPNTENDSGTMLAVKADVSLVEEVIEGFPEVKIANFNSPSQVVLSGKSTEIAKVQQILENKVEKVVLLPVAAAFHTPMMEFARKSFARACRNVTFSQPKIPVYTNLTGQPYPSEPEAIQKNLENHLSNSVLFQQEIENIYAAGGSCFVEFGPRQIISNLVKDILGDRPHISVALNPSRQKDSDRSLREAVINLRVAGLAITNLDPYQLPFKPQVIEQKKPFKVRLSSTNYVSDQTKAAFEKALQSDTPVSLQPKSLKQQGKKSDNHKPEHQEDRVSERKQKQRSEAKSSPKSTINSIKPFISRTKPLRQLGKKTNSQPQKQQKNKLSNPEKKKQSQLVPPSNKKPEMLTQSHKIANHKLVLGNLEQLLTQFQQHQTNNLHLHQNYLNHQTEYIKTFFHLMQQQNSLWSSSQSSSEATELASMAMKSVEQSTSQLHAHQSDTLHVHQQYLQHQSEYNRNFFKVIQQEYTGLLDADVTTSQKRDRFIKSREEIAKVKTESQEKSPECSAVATKMQSEIEVTLEPVVVNSQVNTLDIDLSKLGDNLLEVISDKTGYPIEMLELEMDMEADLGIDSIKRVEILGAMQDLYPDLPEPNLEELSQKRTILQIVDYFQGLTNNPISLEINAVAPSASEFKESAVKAPVINIDLSKLGDNLLEVISDKTGYPIEMLEVEMDMEADLGIDSIKRVEILGAMQDLYPDLPEPNLEELSQKRTILQIVDYFQGLTNNPISLEINAVAPSASEFKESAVKAPVINIDLSKLGDNLIEVISDKTGYPIEMLEMDMDMEADLGIDSIKRVEILGAMQDLYPDLPEPNLEELSQKRTILQIVEYFQNLTHSNVSPEPDVNIASIASEKTPDISVSETIDSDIICSPVRLINLPEPDYWEFDLPKGYICLITDDGSSKTQKLARSFKDKGWQVVVLSLPASFVGQPSLLSPDIPRVRLMDTSEEHLQQQLTAIATKYGEIGAFIHLHPVWEPHHNGKINYLEDEKALVKYVFLIAKHLQKSLSQAANNGNSCFCTVTSLDGALGLKGKSYSPISGGLAGLTKSLKWEWQKVFCRAIDLSPEISSEQAAEFIVAELHDPNLYITEVAYGSEGRVTLVA